MAEPRDESGYPAWSGLDAIVAERDRLREALAALVAWHPATDAKLAELHPQHRQALRSARSCLLHPEGEPDA